MAETIIYAAGNPDFYPIEYYDETTETYEGLMPSIFSAFSERSDWQIRYYRPEEGDQRKELGKNLQVDLLSGCGEQESFADCQPVTLLETTAGGKTVSYQIWVTEAAPEGFADELQEFAHSLSAREQMGMLLEDVQDGSAAPDHFTALPAILLGICLLLAAAVLIVRRRYRKTIRNYQAQLERDPLTGLVNRSSLRKWYERKINAKNCVLFSVVYFRIKIHRQQAGILAEEEALRKISELLEPHLSTEDVVARISDQGIVVLKYSPSSDREAGWVSAAVEKINDYFYRESVTGRQTVSAGLYPLNTENSDLDTAMFCARWAADEAMQQGENVIVFNGKMERQMDEELSLREDIHHALKSDELDLYVQFCLDGRSLDIIGGEALVRWDHPQWGLLGPDHFVPLLEKEGLISDMDYYCLDKSCELLKELAEMGIDDFFLSCNFSRKTFSQEDFAHRALSIVEKYDIGKNNLIFELTESADAENRQKLYENLQEIRKEGIRILLDDFGEGFTSFYDLQELPADGIKLDKHLTDQIHEEKGRLILQAMIELGHQMGMIMFGEGVEDKKKADLLSQIGCDVIQGFFFHYPAPVWNIRQRLRQLARKKIDIPVSAVQREEMQLKTQEKDKQTASPQAGQKTGAESGVLWRILRQFSR